MEHVGTVRELWRYPVKSMAGERLDAVDIDGRGVRGDRLWAVCEHSPPVISGGKRLPILMQCSARYLEEPVADAGPGRVPPVAITLPDGSEVTSDDPRVHQRLSDLVGRRVSLSSLRPADDSEHYRAPKLDTADKREVFGVEPGEPLPDFSMMPASMLAELSRYMTPRGTYLDCYELHILTTASLEAMRALAAEVDFDARRFRPNVLLDTPGADGLLERSWCGGTVRAGTMAARIAVPTVRCSMPTRAQGDLPADPKVMKTIAAAADRCLGVYAEVERTGRVAVGDAVELDPPRRSRLAEWTDRQTTAIKRKLLRAVERQLDRKS